MTAAFSIRFGSLVTLLFLIRYHFDRFNCTNCSARITFHVYSSASLANRKMCNEEQRKKLWAARKPFTNFASFASRLSCYVHAVVWHVVSDSNLIRPLTRSLQNIPKHFHSTENVKNDGKASRPSAGVAQ